jgi:uncharacterized protein (TIGR00730 family)
MPVQAPLPHLSPEQLATLYRPQGLKKAVLKTLLTLATVLEVTLLPPVFYALYCLRHPNATPQQRLDEREGLAEAVRTLPQSMTNKLWRALYPRDLGITVYGSARTEFTDSRLDGLTDLAQAVGKAIASWGYFPVTGGGAGVMANVAIGAKAAGGHTAGAAMDGLDGIIRPQDRVMFDELSIHPTFPHRLYGPNSFIHRSPRALVLPGGFGTLREMFSLAEDMMFDRTMFPTMKQVVVLDPNGFFTEVQHMLATLVASKIASQDKVATLRFVKTIDEAKAALFDPTVPWTPGLVNKKHHSIIH